MLQIEFEKAAKTSQMVCPMSSIDYYTPWFRGRYYGKMPRRLFETLAPRTQELCCYVVRD